MGRSRLVSLLIAATVCANPSGRPVDVWTTQARCPQVHRPNNNRRKAEQNEKCVTHVVGQNCYPCPRLLSTRVCFAVLSLPAASVLRCGAVPLSDPLGRET